MICEIIDNTVLIKGALDETSDETDIRKCIDDVANRDGDYINIDFSQCPRSNSAGIRTFSMVMIGQPKPFRYVKAPEWLLSQFAMISSLLTPGSVVESAILPFYCEESDVTSMVECFIGKEIPLLEDYDDFHLSLEIQGEKYELDCDPEILSFITFRIDDHKKLAS